MLENPIFLLFKSQLCQFTMFYLSHQYHIPGTETDPDRPDLDRHPLVADQDPAK
jgi:hypothetical protein